MSDTRKGLSGACYLDEPDRSITLDMDGCSSESASTDMSASYDMSPSMETEGRAVGVLAFNSER